MINCEYCKFEMAAGTAVCPNCGRACPPAERGGIAQSNEIEILPPEEGDTFQGLTIVQPPEDEKRGESCYEYQSQSGDGSFQRGRVYVRHFSLGNTPGGILGKIIGGAVLLGLVIVALPLALLVIGIFLAGVLLARRRRR